jgi:hypothetical protein
MYQALFGSVGAQQVLQAWRLQPASQRQISIVSDIPRVLSLPWELLHDEQGFLALRERLTDPKRPPVHILHFDGHGAFGQEPIAKDDKRFKSGGPLQGLLAFEDEKGKEHLVSAEELAQVLQHSGIRLAVFNACQSAIGAGDDVFSSVATRLVKAGIDAVVAMSASVLVATATRYVAAF